MGDAVASVRILSAANKKLPHLKDHESPTIMKPASLLAPIAALVCGVHVFAAEALTALPLFNGKDFSGWRGVGYVVEDGAIISTPNSLLKNHGFASWKARSSDARDLFGARMVFRGEVQKRALEASRSVVT